MRVLDAETKSVEMASRLEMSLCLPRDMSVAAVHPRATTVSHCPRMDQMSRNRPKHCHSPVQTVSGASWLPPRVAVRQMSAVTRLSRQRY